jgi:uncharacterized membrane protein
MASESIQYTKAAARLRLRDISARDSYDLLLLIGAALLLPALLLLPIAPLRVPLGLAAALVAPGYALVAALFPRRGDLDGIARAALSVGLSLAVLPALALLLNALPWGLRPWPIAIALMLWIGLCGWVALLRRGLAPAGAADTAPALNPAGWWGAARRLRPRQLAGALAIVVVLAAGALALAASDPSARLTEFYALGAAGQAEDYPRQVAPGEPVQLRLGIANHEGAPGSYRVELRASGQLLGQAGSIALDDGATWEAPLSFALAGAGDDQQVDVLLFRGGEAAPYRRLRLWINVRGHV